MHYCAYHKTEHNNSAFRMKGNGKLDSWCIEGRREYGRKYSRKTYAPAKKTNEKRRSIQPKAKVCSGCGKEKGIEMFPLRSDRPGKRHSRCVLCFKNVTAERNREYNILNFDKIAVVKRKYHAAHPRYNEQSSRRRRARLRQVRQEPYSRQSVRDRDEGLCFFCEEPVNPLLKWPDPLSEVIHHQHPIAKKGPDIFENATLAHNRCNARASDKYESPFKQGWRVEPIGSPLARAIVKEHHYLKRAPNISFAYGLFAPDRELPLGIATFGSPSSFRINRSACPESPTSVIEFNRLWISPGAPYGAASWFVSRALKQMSPYIVVSYADTSVQDPRNGHAHDGNVYKALSFDYAGCTRPRKEWRLPGKSRNVGKIPGAVLEDVSSKHRFWTVTGTRKNKKTLKAHCAWPEMSYVE